MEIIHDAPVAGSFTPLAEHQSHTPESFYSGPPILYHHSVGGRIIVVQADLDNSPALARLQDSAQTNGSLANDKTEDEHGTVIIEDVDVWVTSEKFLFFRPGKLVGVSIPYPSISLHAIQRLQDPKDTQQTQGLLLQITTSDGFDDHDQDGSMEMTFIPASSVPEDRSSTEDTTTTAGTEDPISEGSSTPIVSLFAAVSACANLHASPDSSTAGDREEDDNDMPAFDYEVTDGLPPPMPGSGGWITAENMDQFFDENGNWRGQGLGPGAGIVREREDSEPVVDGAATDEVVDVETKWRRTG